MDHSEEKNLESVHQFENGPFTTFEIRVGNLVMGLHQDLTRDSLINDILSNRVWNEGLKSVSIIKPGISTKDVRNLMKNNENREQAARGNEDKVDIDEMVDVYYTEPMQESVQFDNGNHNGNSKKEIRIGRLSVARHNSR